MINSFIEILKQYGLPGAMLFVLAIIIWRGGEFYVKKIKTQNQQNTDILVKSLSDTISSEFSKSQQAQTEQNLLLVNKITEQNNKLIDTLLSNYREENKQKHKELKESQNKRMRVSPLINDLIKTLTANIGCARTCVVELCNGSHNISGLSFMHYTIGYEYHQRGEIDIDAEMNQKSSLNNISLYVNKINESPENAISLTANELHEINIQNGGFLNKYKHLNITKATLVGLYDNDNTICGFLMLLFSKNYDYDANRFDKLEIKDVASKLSVKLFYNENQYYDINI